MHSMVVNLLESFPTIRLKKLTRYFTLAHEIAHSLVEPHQSILKGSNVEELGPYSTDGKF